MSEELIARERAKQINDLIVFANAAKLASNNGTWRLSEHYNVVHYSNAGVIEGSKQVADVDNATYGNYLVAIQPTVLLPILERVADCYNVIKERDAEIARLNAALNALTK